MLNIRWLLGFAGSLMITSGIAFSDEVPCELEFMWTAQGYSAPFKSTTFPYPRLESEAECLKWCKGEGLNNQKRGITTSVTFLACKSGNKSLSASNVQWTDYCWSSTYGGPSVGYKTWNSAPSRLTKDECLSRCKDANQCKFGANLLFDKPVVLPKITEDYCWTKIFVDQKTGYKTWNSAPKKMTKEACISACGSTAGNQKQCKWGATAIQ